jgi:hypothetical protein
MPEAHPLDRFWRSQKALLRDLFDGRLCIQTAAERLTAIVVPEPPPDQVDDDNDDDDDTMADIEAMWRIILGSLEDAPDRAQIVCDLIICISQLPPVLTRSGQQLCGNNEPAQRVWEDTPCLGISLRDEWNSESYLSAFEIRALTHCDVQLDIETPRQGLEIKRFTTVNELIARLMLHDEKKFNYSWFALWTMRNALEYPLPYSADPRQNQPSLCSIPVAVRLVEIAGRLIFRWDHEFKHGPSEGRPGMGGPLWNGKRDFCRGRWDLWCRRFVDLSSEEWLDEEYRDGAKRAADIMSGIV